MRINLPTIFYIIKPFVPRKLQIYLRRILIKRKQKKFVSIWPILESASNKPKHWKGWPNEKKFALILTHDVEHQKGYNRVLQLMKLEKELGFVGSYNFIPERDYRVEISVINTLNENGFECGVHGLHHDGKLFSSEKEFLKRAGKIKKYANEWNALGFRAPAMHHNLDYIGALNLLYDLSTFDTDPFEPQPDGVNTIFPFWINNKRHKDGGYIEMPYTLAQDSTLYLIMKENNFNIWQTKLEWIIKNEGMALINVHPDYIDFNNTNGKYEEFPIKYYVDFLKHIKTNYFNQYWNALPRDVAMYSKQFLV